MGRLIEREIEIEGVGAQGNSPIHSFLMNDCCSIGGWVGLLASLVFWSGGGLWAAGRQWLRPKSERRQEEKPINSIQQSKEREWRERSEESRQWNEINEINWMKLARHERRERNGGALRPRSSAANQSINSLLKKEEKWKLIWIDCGASCLFFSLSLAGPLAPLARSFILFENEAAMVDYGLSEPSQQARRELVCLSLIREGWKWSEGELMDWSGAGNI